MTVFPAGPNKKVWAVQEYIRTGKGPRWWLRVEGQVVHRCHSVEFADPCRTGEERKPDGRVWMYIETEGEVRAEPATLTPD